MNKFWNWTTQISDDGAQQRVLELCGEIAEETWWGDEVTPKMFKNDLEAGTGDIVVWINSPGGDCYAASEIYTMLSEYKGHVIVKISALAASAASVVAMAGDEIYMAPTALMMIHNPSTFALGDHNDMQKAIDVLEEVKESIINAYELKTGMSRTKLSHLMDDETWMNANKAVELGFADGYLNDELPKNVSDAYAYSTASSIKALTNKITEKEIKEKKQGAKVKDLLIALYDQKYNYGGK